jgi:hypothetical protein
MGGKEGNMVVDRFTFKAKLGRAEELASENKRLYEAAGAVVRVYICHIGMRNKVVVDVEHKDADERNAFWKKFDARPDLPELFARLGELMENDLTTELYRMV